MKAYMDEREGQIEFFERILKRVDRTLTLEDILEDNTDGVINGNILEFKLQINDINKVLFQAVKYLSARRIKGKEIPKNIILISLNDEKAYIYQSADFLIAIEKRYFSSASIENEGFVIKSNISFEKYDLSKGIDQEKLIKILKEQEFTKINIDEYCILGWAERFYREKPEAKKQDFIGDTTGKIKIKGEIRNPTIFKEYINVYQKGSNIKFQYLMDKLNDRLTQKNLGAFYTPEPYVNKSIELVREAIKRVPEGNDYIILDRCAGTGNLESLLSDEELKHTIVSTLEYYEYQVLLERIGDKVRSVIPPYEKEDTFNQGLVAGADALSEEYIYNEYIKQYIDNPKCTIILFENPPYGESNGTTQISGAWKNSFVIQKMKEELKGEISNDLSHAFIWSGFKYYLRQKTDSYIVYSPIKYWKNQHLVNKKYIKGYAFNIKHFHASKKATTSCILWSNEEFENLKELKLSAYDIINNKLEYEKDLVAKKCYEKPSKFYPKSDYNDTSGISVELNGLEYKKVKNRVKTYYDKDIVGFIVANGHGFDNPRLNSSLVRCGRYDGNGAFISKENYFYILPIFSAGKYTDHINDWKIMSFIMRTSDKYDDYMKDVKSGKLDNYLYKTLLWTSLTHYSHMRSLKGSDDRFYRNELCLDSTNGETLALTKLKKMNMTQNEKDLIEQFEEILNLAKETDEYNKEYSYGLYQIDEEINTSYKNENDKTIYNYPELNGKIKVLKSKVKEYYVNNLVEELFEYELLK